MHLFKYFRKAMLYPFHNIYFKQLKCFNYLMYLLYKMYFATSSLNLSWFADNQRLLQEAKLELKKSKRKDYYKVLGVGKSANEDDIKKAYRKRALLHHPGNYFHVPITSSLHACLYKVFPYIFILSRLRNNLYTLSASFFSFLLLHFLSFIHDGSNLWI